MLKKLNDVNSRWANIADQYNQHRFSPPQDLIKWLTEVWGGCELPNIVADFGCGTGLSTRPWASHAKKIIGIDPSDELLSIARTMNIVNNISFYKGIGSKTGFEANSVDIITAMQSIHWMEPKSTLNEILRVLNDNGLLIVYGYELSPMSKFLELEHELFILKNSIGTLTLKYGLEKEIFFLKDSEFFQFVVNEHKFLYNRYFFYSDTVSWDTEQYLGWIYTLGNIQKLKNDVGLTDDEIGITHFKEVLIKYFKSQKHPLIITWKVFLFRNKII